MIRWLSPLFVFAAVFPELAVHAAPAQKAAPNFLVLLVDGIGFSDAGCYGGEISTPNLDQLAKEGVCFTQAYNGAGGHSTRASLLTGYYAQRVLRETQEGPVGNSGAGEIFPDWVQLLPAHLKAAGYKTYHSGNWRINKSPAEVGFDRSYLQDEPARQWPSLPNPLEAQTPQSLTDGGAPSGAIASQAVGFLRQHASENPKDPFFAYVVFDGAHFNRQISADDLLRYKGRFELGVDILRQERLRRIAESGILRDPELFEPAGSSKRWADLTPQKRDEFVTQMEMHAAIVDRMDREMGRILEQIKEMGMADNTVVIFLSHSGFQPMQPAQTDQSEDAAAVGEGDSSSGVGHGASVSNAPLRGSSELVHEGGLSAPFIVRWPAGFKARGELREQPVHVIDIAPTLLKIANVSWPKKYGDVPVPASDGVDLTGILKENKPLPSRPLWWSHAGNRAFRLGDWKWIASRGESAELYYIKADRAEMRDLAPANAERLLEMETQWTKMAKKLTENGGIQKTVSDSK